MQQCLDDSNPECSFYSMDASGNCITDNNPNSTFAFGATVLVDKAEGIGEQCKSVPAKIMYKKAK